MDLSGGVLKLTVTHWFGYSELVVQKWILLDMGKQKRLVKQGWTPIRFTAYNYDQITAMREWIMSQNIPDDRVRYAAVSTGVGRYDVRVAFYDPEHAVLFSLAWLP